MASLTPVRESVSAEDPVPMTMTVDQYLSTMFHPDCDFVDGRIEERNVGEVEHSKVQKMLLRLFAEYEATLGIDALPEVRLQVAKSRFRIPDVMVLGPGAEPKRIVRTAPLICIEVLSPEDTWKRLSVKLRDYLAMGVPNIWVFDPDKRTAHRFDADGLHLVTEADLVVPGTEIRMIVAEVFSLLRKN
jgi:Uma2 family endonuclease